MRTPAPLVLALLTTLAASSCKQQDEAPSSAAIELIPDEIRGTYGRTAEDAPGMQVTATGLSFGQMQLTIHAGKMEGGTVRVERATLQWQKLEPKTCSGTISRQGDRLLMTLYDSENDQRACEATLDAEWSRWQELDALPELIRGRYGALLVEPQGLRLDLEWLHDELKIGVVHELPGSNDERAELLLEDAEVQHETDEGEHERFTCAGTMTLEDGLLRTDFWVPRAQVPEPGSEAAAKPEVQARLAAHELACDNWDGRATKWEVSLAELPQQPIRSGEVSLAITAEQVVLDSPHLRCVQPLWRTESVESRAGRPGAQAGAQNGAQFGGERMTLGNAEPSGVSEDCKLKLRIGCEVQDGADTREIDAEQPPAEHVAACMDLAQHELCPDSITVRAISNTRFEVHVEAPSFDTIACLGPTGEFSL